MDTKNIRVAIVDDHMLIREGLRFILSATDHIKVISCFRSGLEFIQELGNLEVDLVLMDINMPEMDGLEATRIAIEKRPELKILALSMFDTPDYFHKMVNAGASGFVLKEAKGEELVLAIGKIISGESYFSPEILRKVISHNYKNFQDNHAHDTRIDISSRELEVLKLLCEGLTNGEISDKLFISQRTVEGHRANLLKKTATKNTISLIMFALRNRIIEL